MTSEKKVIKSLICDEVEMKDDQEVISEKEKTDEMMKKEMSKMEMIKIMKDMETEMKDMFVEMVKMLLIK